jgi:hypothetical protein
MAAVEAEKLNWGIVALEGFPGRSASMIPA